MNSCFPYSLRRFFQVHSRCHIRPEVFCILVSFQSSSEASRPCSEHPIQKKFTQVRCIFAFEIWRQFQRRMGCIVRGHLAGISGWCGRQSVEHPCAIWILMDATCDCFKTSLHATLSSNAIRCEDLYAPASSLRWRSITDKSSSTLDCNAALSLLINSLWCTRLSWFDFSLSKSAEVWTTRSFKFPFSLSNFSLIISNVLGDNKCWL